MLKLLLIVLSAVSLFSCNQKKSDLSDQKTDETENTQKSKIETERKTIDSTKREYTNAEDTVKKISFNDFAKDFMKEAFKSSNKLSEYSEKSFKVISIEGNTVSGPSKEFKELKRWREEVYNKYSIKNNMIYVYGIITEHDPQGTKQGMKLFFKKDSNDNWKLYKIEYEGC